MSTAEAVPVEVVLLLASGRHRYDGRPVDGSAPVDADEVRSSVEVRAGLGVVSDRFFNASAHRKASVTVFAAEQLDLVEAELSLPAPIDAAVTRRNIVLRGVDVDGLRGRRFTLDTGDGPVGFEAHRPANPCAWMDVVIAPGAFRALRGRGGMRCAPTTDGRLVLGPGVLRLEPA